MYEKSGLFPFLEVKPLDISVSFQLLTSSAYYFAASVMMTALIIAGRMSSSKTNWASTHKPVFTFFTCEQFFFMCTCLLIS